MAIKDWKKTINNKNRIEFKHKTKPYIIYIHMVSKGHVQNYDNGNLQRNWGEEWVYNVKNIKTNNIIGERYYSETSKTKSIKYLSTQAKRKALIQLKEKMRIL
jgi:hypothetical protein